MQLWYPRRERGLVQGVTHSASRLGAAIAPPIVVLIMSDLGWRPVFYICGAVGLMWSLWWALSYRNLPEEHGLVNQGGAGRHPRPRTERRDQPPPMEKQTNVPWGTLAAISQYVGDHVRIFHLRLLPVDFPELAAVLSDRVSGISL